MKQTLLLLSCVTLCGCVRFSVTQTDKSSLDENQEEVRTIETRITGSAWFSSAQSLAKLKVSQTDKSQTTGLDSIGQHGSTNTVAALDALARLADAVRPTP